VTAQERDLLAFHVVFLGLGFAALVLRGPVPHGWVLTGAVVVYHLASDVVTRRRGHPGWRRWWQLGAVLSVFMVLPDAVLAEGLGILEFAPDGVPKLGPVSLYMAGLWAVPTVLIVAAADAVERRSSARAAGWTAVVAAVVVFGGAEATLTLLPVWEPVGVTTVGGFAPYILPPEMLLGWLVFAGARWTRTGPRRAMVPVAALIALVYAGAAVVSWLLVERALLGGVLGT
jgi:hypothetical protein